MDADVQPLIQDQQRGLGSWHPAMRPNIHESNLNHGEQMTESFSRAIVPESTAERNVTSYRLPFRPKTSAQEQPASLPSQADNFQSGQRSQELYPSTGGATDVLLDDEDPHWFRQVGRATNGDEAEGTLDNAVDVETARSEPPSDFAPRPVNEAVKADGHTDERPGALLAEPRHVDDVLGDKASEPEEKHNSPNGAATISRTNSFPEVLPLRKTRHIPPHPLPRSQAEDVMEEDETAESLERGPSRDAFPATNADTDAQRDAFESLKDEDEDEGFFANLQKSQTTLSTSEVEAEEESRYEEGLPLLLSSSQLEPRDVQGQFEEVVAEGPNPVIDEDDFFKRMPQPADEDLPSYKPYALDRKTTTQVLDSIQYAPHAVTHSAPEADGDRPSLGNPNGVGIAVSAHAVKSQVFAGHGMESTEPNPKDEDLAEMWKAALGDDDLLEENEGSLDPSSFFGEDGEGFLEDNPDLPEISQQQSATSPPLLEPVYDPDGRMRGFGESNAGQSTQQSKYMPAAASQPQMNASASYLGQTTGAPHQQLPQLGRGLDNSGSAPIGLADSMRWQTYGSQASSRPQMPASTQSFADKSKGGYTSPYDLPMDVTRPKKRTIHQQMRPSTDVQPPSNRPPPPRSSSMFTGAPPPIASQPPVPRLSSAYSSSQAGNAVSPTLKNSPSMGSFFEELPSSKPRPATSMGRSVPPASQPIPPSPVPQRDPPRQSSLPQPPVSKTDASSQQYQLLPPERLSLYGNVSKAEPANNAVPAMNARYSPAPVPPSNFPPPRNRYAPSPSAGTRVPPSQALPFQPRTSSPLAQNHLPPQKPQGFLSDQSFRQPQSSDRFGLSGQEVASPSFPFPGHQSPQELDTTAYRRDGTGGISNQSQWRQSPPPLAASQYAPLNNSASDSSYTMNTSEPGHLSSDSSSSFPQPRETRSYEPKVSNHSPPRRSQTQSPGTGKCVPELASTQNPYQRPASVNHQQSIPPTGTKLPPVTQVRPRGRTFSKDLNYIRPTDGREMDKLERWKGCPVFSFGFGGAIVTSIPKHIPRYAAGQSIPLIKCSPGEVKLQDGKILPLEEDIAAFPGPLKSKGKKKEVLDWLRRRISKLEDDGTIDTTSAILPNPIKRHEEKILLWKIVCVLVEHDGAVDGNPWAEKAVRSFLSPELTQGDTATLPFQASNSSLLGITLRSRSRAIPDSVKPEAIEEMRKILLHGEREKAVWHAVDNRLWAHAMLLSSTLDKNIWKQVSQEFVRQEVKTYGDNTEALAALYQIFAGNWDESADELVPPSARAGLQMVSKTTSTGPTKNALDGLDRWRETLTLILSNRSPDDGKALSALGQLLSGYGRTEAAHICYIFAKLPGLFGGPDDPQVSIALLGADHLQQPFNYGRDLDSILLTEVYDFARTVLAPSSAATVSPHLQSFKLYHAMILAEHGYKFEAQQYCEVITSTLNSTTKRSPYYHDLLFGALDDLGERLRQAPRDSSGSWISKPSIDKVSGSIWAKFNQYVVGDESDAASTGSGKGPDLAAGPFAGFAGDSPTLSRTPSSSDMYNSYAPGIGPNPPAPIANPAVSRYAPAGLYSPRSSIEQPGRSSQDFQRPTQNDSLRPALAQQQYQPRPVSSSAGSYNEPHKPIPPPSSYPPHNDSYLPAQPSQPEYMPMAPPDELSTSPYPQEPYQLTPPLEAQPSQDHYQPHVGSEYSSGHYPLSLIDDPASHGYGPPSTNDYGTVPWSSYNPPSYNPDVPQAEDPVEEKPKKKSFMDDDEDDFSARAAAMRKEEKARKDREAVEAFRRAAEADSQKDKAPKLNSKKSGWFGGWLGSKKEAEDAHGTPNAPIKAKLGEQSSFYYDSEQKRWVNKKNPDATPAPTAAPPPPRGPPSRAVSVSGQPPPSSTATPPLPPLPTTIGTPPIASTKPPTPNVPGLNPPTQYPSRSPSPAVNTATPNEPVLQAGPMTSPPSSLPSAPPSRPATGMSGASSIDDLIGAPQARKGGTVRKGKKGRGYVDVMAK